jgi:thermitase
MKSLKFTLPALLAVFAVFVSQNICLGHAEASDSVFGSDQPIVTNLITSSPDTIHLAEIKPNTAQDQTRSTLNYSVSNDPYNDRQWSLKTMQVPNLMQNTSANKREVLVAILDTGVDNTHEDLQSRVAAEIDLTGGASPSDLNGHGTHIAGIIAANNNNRIGISGLASDVKILNVKVADSNGTCKANIVSKGIIWAVDSGARIINISLEFSSPSLDMENALNYAWQKGCLVISSASNLSIYPVYPAFYDNCLAVAAIDENDNTGKLAYNGDWIDIAAPGFSIYSTLPGNEYGYKSGTSFATAQVSGLAAVLYGLAVDQNEDGKLNDEVREAILLGAQTSSSDKIKRINFTNSIFIIN